MKKILQSDTINIGLAIFSMLFGAGNLMYPIKVGMSSGSYNLIGMLGFSLTAVFLPVFGLISMMLFEGDYRKFFNRMGKTVGNIILLICMLIIGPMIAIPRIVTLSHTMIAPFLPISTSSFVFAVLFLGLTFLLTFRESKIVELLGKYISPALLISLVIIIFKGFFTKDQFVEVSTTTSKIFTENLLRGYETLDLLGGLFFASIVLTILRNKFSADINKNPKMLISISLKAGLIGTSLLGLVYLGLSYLGAYHGFGLEGVNEGELFRDISFRVLGSYGAFVIATAVLMACLSTAIALSAVLAEFVKDNYGNRISFSTALLIVLATCLPLSTFGLGAVLKLTAGPIVFIGYPILIAITFLNIAYKMFGFKPIKLPVLITAIAATLLYFR